MLIPGVSEAVYLRWLVRSVKGRKLEAKLNFSIPEVAILVVTNGEAEDIPEVTGRDERVDICDNI